MAAAAAPPPAAGVMVLLLARCRSGAVPWALSRLVLGRRGLGPVDGLRFARVLGSGRGGGFGIVPSLHHHGLVGFFDDEDSAHRFVDSSPAAAAYRAHADEFACGVLRATASRGSWGGATLAVTATATPGERCAALTRASIRPRWARRFWGHTPTTGHDLAAAKGCRLAVGLGEAPIVRQATFSVWDDTAAMEAYARQGAHRDAAAGAWRERWFSEWMFVRLKPLRLEGRWHGTALA